MAAASMENDVEDKNTTQERAESLKAEKDQQKQEIARLTEELKIIKIIVKDLHVDANTMSSQKNNAVSKVQKLQE